MPTWHLGRGRPGRPQMRPLGMWRHPVRTRAHCPVCVRPRANSDLCAPPARGGPASVPGEFCLNRNVATSDRSNKATSVPRIGGYTYVRLYGWKVFDPSIRRRSRATIQFRIPMEEAGGSRKVPRPIPACWSNSMRQPGRWLRSGTATATHDRGSSMPARPLANSHNELAEPPQEAKYVRSRLTLVTDRCALLVTEVLLLPPISLLIAY